MSDPEVVVRLLAAIDERERKARAATQGPWRHNPRKHWRKPGTTQFEEAVFSGPTGAEALCIAGTGETDDPQSMADAAHIAANGPDAVLRLCQSHRDIVAEWRKRKQMADQLRGEGHPDAPVVEAITAGLFAAVILVARGYGIEDGEN